MSGALVSIPYKSAAAQAARKTPLLLYPFIRPLARLGFCRNFGRLRGSAFVEIIETLYPDNAASSGLAHESRSEFFRGVSHP